MLQKTVTKKTILAVFNTDYKELFLAKYAEYLAKETRGRKRLEDQKITIKIFSKVVKKIIAEIENMDAKKHLIFAYVHQPNAPFFG